MRFVLFILATLATLAAFGFATSASSGRTTPQSAADPGGGEPQAMPPDCAGGPCGGGCGDCCGSCVGHGAALETADHGSGGSAGACGGGSM